MNCFNSAWHMVNDQVLHTTQVILAVLGFELRALHLLGKQLSQAHAHRPFCFSDFFFI
jgi:hypothetical protein